jgi:hypothetical protein
VQFSSSRVAQFFAGLLLGLAPTIVCASDFRGFLSGVLIFALGSMSAMLSLACFAVLAMRRAYREFRVAKRHATLAAIVPALGFGAMFLEGNSVPRVGVVDRMVFNGVALALALLPLLAHQFMRDPGADAEPPNPHG